MGKSHPLQGLHMYRWNKDKCGLPEARSAWLMVGPALLYVVSLGFLAADFLLLTTIKIWHHLPSQIGGLIGYKALQTLSVGLEFTLRHFWMAVINLALSSACLILRQVPGVPAHRGGRNNGQGHAECRNVFFLPFTHSPCYRLSYSSWTYYSASENFQVTTD